MPLPYPLASAHLGAAADGTAAAILMPDLSASLIPWDRRDGSAAVIDDEALDRVLAAAATIHALPWASLRPSGPGPTWPWCPLPERLQLTSRPAAERYGAGGLPIGARFITGWDAFDLRAPRAARDLVDALARDVAPLIRALEGLPSTGLHGDLKLANVALLPDGRSAAIDWQMVSFAPVAVELGWFLVANVAQVRAAPDATLDRYRHALAAAGGEQAAGDWAAQRDLAVICGLLLRGWRKGLDAADEVLLPTGISAEDDLQWWAREAVAAARRRL